MLFLFYLVSMKKGIYLALVCTLCLSVKCIAQTDTVLFVKEAIKSNRAKTYNNIINNSITKNLSLSLNDSTEENWQDAFYAMELINYKAPWVDVKIKIAFDSIEKRSTGFQRALLELLYSNYTTACKSHVNKLLLSTTNAKIFAMCAEYLLRADRSKKNITTISKIALYKRDKYFVNDESSAFIVSELVWPLMPQYKPESASVKLRLDALLNQHFLKGNSVIYSIQRKNRNYPGIAIVRDKNGNFITDDKGNLFSVPQLARSITNLSGYLTNGNTPQGIFRMNGFEVSKSNAIGPTENIQLMMPFETSIRNFLKDSVLTDTAWTTTLYERLLPDNLKNDHPLLETFYASAIGRTEIIAHGTTVDPEYYKGQFYYPLTPTQGCLCTKEIWSQTDGQRSESNQQKLVDALKKAGGADGYCIVIEIDNQQKPVSIHEILPYIK